MPTIDIAKLLTIPLLFINILKKAASNIRKFHQKQVRTSFIINDENGIVTGVDEAIFAPKSAITREQFAAIMYRYAQYKGMDTSAHADLSNYTDNASISAYAREALSWANATGLINGMSTTELAPQAQATRAQTAAILWRWCEDAQK